MIFGIVQNSLIVNIIDADKKEDIYEPNADYIIEIKNPDIKLGDFYINGKFFHKPTTEEQFDLLKQILKENYLQIKALNNRVNILENLLK